ncbi:MAG TPA: DNA methyltransferase [Trebonia sp.]|jgi:DNA modification methylase|nr:DNA methyltransferase [Trebonia sp.]
MSSRGRSEQYVQELLNRVDWNFVDYNPSERAPEVHGLHWYPAPFPPGLAGTLIEILGDGGTFLDPFSGSGVGPIEAWLRGYKAVGIDVNPMAVRIGQAKAHLLAAGNASDGESLVEDYSKFRRSRINYYLECPSEDLCVAAKFEQDAIRWFTPSVLSELAIIKDWMASSGTVSDWSDVVLVLVSSILHRRLSELRHVHYTYVVDRSRAKHPPKNTPDPYSEVKKKITSTFIRTEVTRSRLERAGVFPSSLQTPPLFVVGNSEKSLSSIDSEVDLVVTSPPYFGMNDYVRSQYLTWLIFPWDTFDRDVALEIGTRRDRRSAVKMNQYLDSLGVCFKTIGQMLRVGGHAAVVMGTSHTSAASVRPEIDDLSAALSMADLHPIWRGVRRVVYRKINNTPYREEHIWVMRKGV